MGRELKAGDCKGLCAWSGQDDEIDGLQVFACASCGQEWTSAEAWTPRNADGERDPGVDDARAANPTKSAW